MYLKFSAQIIVQHQIVAQSFWLLFAWKLKQTRLRKIEAHTFEFLQTMWTQNKLDVAMVTLRYYFLQMQFLIS